MIKLIKLNGSSFVAAIVIAIALFVATTLLSTTALAKGSFSASSVVDHVYLVQGPSGNTLVAVDQDGLILVEGVPEKYAKEYLSFVKKTTGEKRIKALVNTHWHPESAGLNASMRKAGVDVIAHANTKQWLGANIYKRGELTDHKPVAGKYLPNVTFYDTYSIPFRSGSIELGYMLQAHTDGDIYAYLPQQDVFYSGPVLHSDHWSAVDEPTNGFIGGLMDALDAIDQLTKDSTKIVPASGATMNKGNFVAQKDMYKGLMKDMVALLRAAKSPEEVVAANPAAGLQPEWGDPSEFLDQGFRSFFGHLRDARHVGVMP